MDSWIYSLDLDVLSCRPTVEATECDCSLHCNSFHTHPHLKLRVRVENATRYLVSTRQVLVQRYALFALHITVKVVF